jgi:hypothetical protein
LAQAGPVAAVFGAQQLGQFDAEPGGLFPQQGEERGHVLIRPVPDGRCLRALLAGQQRNREPGPQGGGAGVGRVVTSKAQADPDRPARRHHPDDDHARPRVKAEQGRHRAQQFPRRGHPDRRGRGGRRRVFGGHET